MSIEIRSAPHIKGARTVEIIMRHVVWSLMPICAFYIFQYGLSALASIIVVTASCAGDRALLCAPGRPVW